jgi:hypothetical protein
MSEVSADPPKTVGYFSGGFQFETVALTVVETQTVYGIPLILCNRHGGGGIQPPAGEHHGFFRCFHIDI